jgi:predicted metal-dependent enzyme (double-stranded beta helix superfamily)
MFDLNTFVSDCRAAVAEDDTHRTALEVVEAAFDDPAAILAVLGEPTGPGIDAIYRSDDLTILNIVWGPRQTLMPHNHEMWAIIGIYTGREDNIFWRRVKDDPARVEAAGARTLLVGDVTPLGKDIIHSVTNPLSRLTGAIHVYGGDFFAEPRSEWDEETLSERPYDISRLQAAFG